MPVLARAYGRMLAAGPAGPLERLLFVLCVPLSALFRLAVAVRVLLYRLGLLRSYRATVPVVSVGNLTVGGTGKTPVVDFLLKGLAARGVRAAVVSRGYGGRFCGAVGRISGDPAGAALTAAEAGDEPCLLARRNPAASVFVARRRALGVQAAERSGAQIIILDDGFQHLAVRRDLDIVLLDERAPFGNGWLLPAGPLREPVAALRRAGLCVLTHAAGPPSRQLALTVPVVRCRHRLAETLHDLGGQTWVWRELVGRRVVAFAGIARPADFFAALRARGLDLAETLPLDDHQAYDERLLSRLRQSCDNNKLLLTTEKDAIKLHADDFPVPCLVAPLGLEFDDGEQLLGAVARLLDGENG